MKPDPLLNLQNLCNKLLRDDPYSLAAVQALAGRIVALEISGPDLVVFVQFNDQGIVLMREVPGEAHVTIKAGVTTYLGMMLDRNTTVSRRTPDMSITGDVTLAQRFQKILQDLKIDWEEQLSHWIGDTAAHKLVRLAREGRQYAKDAGNTLAMDVSEYLRYEKDLLPDRTEVDEFINAVDRLRNDVERFSARLDRIGSKLSDKE